MNRIKHQFGVFKEVAYVTYKEWSAYRTHSLVSVFVGPVYFIVQFFIWSALYGGHSELNGIGLSAMLTYFGANALIGYLTMDFADWNLQMLVRTGKFLTFCIRPIHHRFFAFSQKCGHRVIGLFLEFLPCYIIFILLFDVNMIPEYPLWTVLSVGLAFLINFYLNYIIGLTAFWLTQAQGVRAVIKMLAYITSGSAIPLVFYPEILQKLLLFLPFQYIAYVPAMVFTGEYQLAGIHMSIPEIVGLQACMAVAMFLLSEVLYRVSIRRFTGVGA